mgnify:CR=1 FL=1
MSRTLARSSPSEVPRSRTSPARNCSRTSAAVISSPPGQVLSRTQLTEHIYSQDFERDYARLIHASGRHLIEVVQMLLLLSLHNLLHKQTSLQLLKTHLLCTPH